MKIVQERYFMRLAEKVLDIVQDRGTIEAGELASILGIERVTLDRALVHIRNEVLTGKTKTRTVYIDAERAKR